MDYEHTAGRAADGLLSYRDDQSGWQVCKKSVRFGFICPLLDVQRLPEQNAPTLSVHLTPTVVIILGYNNSALINK